MNVSLIHFISFPDLQDKRGFTPFHWALKSGNAQLINLVLDYLDSIDNSPSLRHTSNALDEEPEGSSSEEEDQQQEEEDDDDDDEELADDSENEYGQQQQQLQRNRGSPSHVGDRREGGRKSSNSSILLENLTRNFSEMELHDLHR